MAAALALPETDALLQTIGTGAIPIFALPPHPGLDIGYAALARALPEAAIHAARFSDKPVDDLVGDYVALFERLNTQKPAVLLGYSAGGKLALALAHALERAGKPLRGVVLIDTWSWAQASPDVRARIDAEMIAALAADSTLAAAYRARMSGFEPAGPVQAPVHHLHAADVSDMPDMSDASDAAASGLSRDWRHLAGSRYCEYRIPGAHHQLLDAAHVTHTAALLRTILQESLRHQASQQHS